MAAGFRKGHFGPMKGRRLTPVYIDELTLERWKEEKPHGRILKPDPAITASKGYATPEWEQRISQMPLVTKADGILPQREIIIGVEIGGVSKAYPQKELSSKKPIIDRIGNTSIILCVADDGKSVRCFDTSIDGKRLEFFAKQDATAFTLFDATTGGEWGFDGVARSGPLAGRKLTRIPVLKDYWFDWKNYHPTTLLYRP